MSEVGRPHYNLEAWKKSMMLVKTIYQITQGFPKEELFCLVSQMRRAAISVPSNLAEGAARKGRKEFSQFINIARGSISELETQVLISKDLGYLDEQHEVFNLMDNVSRLLTGLHKSVSK